MEQTVSLFRTVLELPSVFVACEQAAYATTREEAATTLQPLLQELLPPHGYPSQHRDDRQQFLTTVLDYNLLYSLLTKNFQAQTMNDLDLSGLPLNEASFRHATLQNVNLSSSHLRSATFFGASLRQVNLVKCVADYSTWEEVTCDQVDFEEAHLAYARFQINASGVPPSPFVVNFEKAHLTYASFWRSDLNNTMFSYATMPHVRFSDTSLKFASLTGANLYQSHAQDVVADHANFRGASLIQADWQYTSMTSAGLTEARLLHATMHHVHFDFACFDQADLYGANLTHMTASHADFSGANLTCADLAYADLRFAVFVDVLFYGTNLQETNTVGAYFGSTFQVDEDTVIPQTSHDLMSMLLLSHATTWEERQFATAIRVSHEMCWKQFALQLRKTPALIPWVRRVLSSSRSLTNHVANAERWVSDSSLEGDEESDDPDNHPF